ncbi:MAG TPA: DUF1330 domain-containing protein [Burkholderiales bacterium]|nr:DUF1330 domain-containing protein [Burkholderiales bacterium]
MPKAYLVVTYRKVKDPEKLAAYAKLAGPATEKNGGKFLVRGVPSHTKELGMKERTVVSEWESVTKVLAHWDSPAYQEALRALGDAAERDVRIVEGI